MSRPDFENIDLWLFEYSEGNLSPEQVEQLRFFVFLHPELEIELDAWESAKVDATPIEYPHFDKLYKQPRLTAIPLTATLTALALLLLFVIPVKTEKWTSNKGDVSRNSADMIAELTAQVESLKQENRELKANNQALRNSSASTSDAISFRPERTDLTVTSISGRTNSVTRAMNSSERRNETNTSGASLVSNELNSVFSAEMDLVTNDAEQLIILRKINRLLLQNYRIAPLVRVVTRSRLEVKFAPLVELFNA